MTDLLASPWETFQLVSLRAKIYTITLCEATWGTEQTRQNACYALVFIYKLQKGPFHEGCERGVVG